jgi:hypothetical protein
MFLNVEVGTLVVIALLVECFSKSFCLEVFHRVSTSEHALQGPWAYWLSLTSCGPGMGGTLIPLRWKRDISYLERRKSQS